MTSLLKTGVLIFFLAGGWAGISTSYCQDHKSEKTQKGMKLKITIGDNELEAELYDTPTGRDFISRLPLTVELEDYANNEKIFYPKPELSTADAPEGFDPSAGDITYYAPWGDIAIFYKDFKYSSGLISIGKIEEDDLEYLKFSGKQRATFELME